MKEWIVKSQDPNKGVLYGAIDREFLIIKGYHSDSDKV